MITIEVNGQDIFEKHSVIATDSINYPEIKFKFSADWEGLAKTVIFKNPSGETAVSVVLNSDECKVPYEVLKEKEFSVSVYGVKDNLRITTTECRIPVIKSGFVAETDEPSSPTPTEYEQILSIMQENRQISENLRKDAEDGKFKGEKGDKGDTGAQGIQGTKGDKGDTGEQGIKGDKGDRGEKGEKGDAFVYTDFTDEQIANLKGEKGDKGDKGEKGDTGAQGLKGDKGDKGEKGDLTELQMNTACCNPIKGSAIGNSITISDISPNEHNLKVKVYSKNLIAFPYSSSSFQNNGITCTVNSDGSITANGTASVNSFINISSLKFLQKGTTYTLSGCPENGSLDSYYLCITNSQGKRINDAFDIGEGKTFTFDAESTVFNLLLCVKQKNTVENLVFKPQIELGSSATEHSLNFKDFTSLTVTESGGDETKTFIPLSDGTVDNITSIYPETNLSVNSSAVTLTAEYNRDINKVISELQALILDSGS